MPISVEVKSTLRPDASRLRTVLESLKRKLDPVVQEVKFSAVMPEIEERENKVIYLELESSDLTIESLQGTQRSFDPLRVLVAGFIRDGDPLVGVDFLNEVLDNLLSDTAIQSYYDVFGADDGFSIEKVEGIGWEYGEGLGSQIRLGLVISMHFPQQS